MFCKFVLLLTEKNKKNMKEQIKDLLKDNLFVWINKAARMEDILSTPHELDVIQIAEREKAEAMEKIFEISNMIKYIDSL
jgi:hypothetical protein